MRDEADEKRPDWVKLVNVSNQIEFSIIKSLLDMAEIPAVKKVGNLGGYAEILTGISFEGIDIYVPEDRYEEAREMIETQEDNSEGSPEESPEHDVDISE
ncbi:MAG: DUF2007 domain-containing protein [Eubacteriales bacterium]|nr:DUF2007 domain-containing protein [Eubacteriales bacterium]